MTENINDTRTGTKFAPVEDLLSIHITASNETTLVSEIPNIIGEENVITTLGQRKTPISILSDKLCKEQTFLHLLPKGKYFFNAPQNVSIRPAWYCNQRLRNLTQYFASDADYIFFARSAFEQHHMHSSINFAMHKIKPGTLPAGTVKSNFKRQLKGLL